jgi:hypothetical protein
MFQRIAAVSSQQRRRQVALCTTTQFRDHAETIEPIMQVVIDEGDIR